jgi:hypothetical protein
MELKLKLATECFVCGTPTTNEQILCPTCDRLRLLASIPDGEEPFVVETVAVN